MANRSEQAARDAARAELIAAIEQLGYPEEFGQVIANELGGEKSMRRMAAYVRSAQPSSPEEIADEMLAILEQRRTWVQHKISERANAHITDFYNRDRGE